MNEFTVGTDGTVRFEGMTRAEVDAEVVRLDVGGLIPEGLSADDHMQFFDNANRLEELFDVLEQWPSPETIEAAVKAAEEHGVTRVQVQLPPRPDDDI